VHEVFISFPELKPRGVRYTRQHLGALMDAGIFPPAVQVGPNRIGWVESDIERFIASRPPAGEPAPRLWPGRERKPKNRSKPVGRPPGARVIGGKVVRPEAIGAADAA